MRRLWDHHDFGFRISDFGFRISDFGFRISDERRRTARVHRRCRGTDHHVVDRRGGGVAGTGLRTHLELTVKAFDRSRTSRTPRHERLDMLGRILHDDTVPSSVTPSSSHASTGTPSVSSSLTSTNAPAEQWVVGIEGVLPEGALQFVASHGGGSRGMRRQPGAIRAPAEPAIAPRSLGVRPHRKTLGTGTEVARRRLLVGVLAIARFVVPEDLNSSLHRLWFDEATKATNRARNRYLAAGNTAETGTGDEPCNSVRSRLFLNSLQTLFRLGGFKGSVQRLGE